MAHFGEFLTAGAGVPQYMVKAEVLWVGGQSRLASTAEADAALSHAVAPTAPTAGLARCQPPPDAFGAGSPAPSAEPTP
ncbi:hypothetical protein [Streptomyces sp. NPDC057909]|uniref:hypothetical protein n=1 Tax=Streptomyces sp. NPDC057909 TaxID=3346277 RepID=UPI0036E76B3C